MANANQNSPHGTLDVNNLQNVVGPFGVKLRNGTVIASCLFKALSGDMTTTRYTVLDTADGSEKAFATAAIELAWRV